MITEWMSKETIKHVYNNKSYYPIIYAELEMLKSKKNRSIFKKFIQFLRKKSITNS